MKPILQWAGGKRNLLDTIKSRFPLCYENFHEPMIGGGAVFFEIEPDSGSINDYNTRLVNVYKQARDNPEELIETLDNMKPPVSEPDPSKEFSENKRKGSEIDNYYYQQRELFNRRPNGEKFDEIEEAARFIYLNRTCYNALYRENQSGEFNVPIGSDDNPDWNPRERIKKASKVLEGIDIYNKDFEYILEEAETNDFVYLDPPYKPLSSTEDFTEYTKKGFDKEDQSRLLDLCSKLTEKNIYVMISNSGIMFDKYNSHGMFVSTVKSPRPINSDPDKRGEVEEILATNYQLQSYLK